MARAITRYYGDCPTHGPAVEFGCNGRYFCRQCESITYRMDRNGGCAEINLRRIDTPRSPKAGEQCNGKCVNGKHACACHCGGRCHGAGTCYCND